MSTSNTRNGSSRTSNDSVSSLGEVDLSSSFEWAQQTNRAISSLSSDNGNSTALPVSPHNEVSADDELLILSVKPPLHQFEIETQPPKYARWLPKWALNFPRRHKESRRRAPSHTYLEVKRLGWWRLCVLVPGTLVILACYGWLMFLWRQPPTQPITHGEILF